MNICKICGKEIPPSYAYSFKDKTLDCCHKECRIMGCYDDKPWTFFPIMQLFDIPYIENQWFNKMKTQIKIAINTHQYKSVFGKYFATMKLKKYKDKGFKDSLLLNNLNLSYKNYKNDLIRDFLLDSNIPQKYFKMVGLIKENK